MTVVARRPLDASAVTEAASLIASHIRRTPTERSEALSVLSGREVILKLENLQKTGAFKIRGALHALLRKDARERVNGVVTASAGNHGQGVAYAAQLLGVPATVVLPHGVPLAKLTAIQRTGAEALLLGESYDDAHAAALDIARERKRAYIHAFDDDDVIAGQGTLALELLDDVRDLDTLVVPVGGGGLIAGVALAASARTPRAREFAGTGVSWNDPEGGFYFWVRLPAGVDARVLLDAALEEGVAFVPGEAFAIDRDHSSALRFSISAPSPDRIDEGVRRLRRAFDRLA
ncbi:MAG: hypothetical protein AUH33_04105 [Chloroflexi bacterium 13_1_40CM_68_21]|nr:MAG: hypothetical protein AUH33_04105 [Chloroflexi bacterium 13_1_40CM_68_21]